MRILITISPGLGHLFPVVPTAWALQAAGHDVLVATAGNTDHAVRAGLSAHDVATDVDMGAVFGEFMSRNGREFRASLEGDPVTGTRFAARLFARLSDVTADATVDVAEQWLPDLVVHTTLQGAGPLVAAKLGIPAVEQTLLLAGSELMTDTLREHMTEAYQRHGVVMAPTRTTVLDVVPPSLTTGARGLPMRYVPYNGGCLPPRWTMGEPERPRIAVTFGTTPRFGPDPLPAIVDAAAGTDAEFVLALGDVAPPGDLPSNVRSVGWMPLRTLLRSCAALVHHGGSGTTFAALVAGVPQLVFPSGADQVYNAQVIAKRGLGSVVPPDQVDPDLLSRLLTEPGMGAAAAEVAAEIAARPTPAQCVSDVVALAS